MQVPERKEHRFRYTALCIHALAITDVIDVLEVVNKEVSDLRVLLSTDLMLVGKQHKGLKNMLSI